jgi:MFS family permease
MRLADFVKANATWLGAGAMLTFLSSFGQTFFISIFAGEIRAFYDLSHGDWGAIYAIGTMSSACVMIWLGTLADRFRARTLGAAILVGLALTCLAMSINTTVLLLPVIIFCLRLFGQGMSHHIATVTMARWFVATRGRALAIAGLGFSVGEIALPVIFVALAGFLDWRVLWVLAAAIVFLSLPGFWTLLKSERQPGSEAEDDTRTGMSGRHWTRADVLKSLVFWCAVPAIAGLSAFGTAVFFHQVHFSEIKGYSHLTFVSLIPIYTIVTVAAMILYGIALDRIGSIRLLPTFQLPLVAAFLLFGLGQGPIALALGFVAFGISSGGNSTLISAFWAETYGTANIGGIKALASAVMVLGSAIGPGLTGYFIDAGIGLDRQYTLIAAYFLFTSAALWVGARRALRSL